MKRKIFYSLLILMFVVFLFNFTVQQPGPDIPKVWDVAELKSMHIPYANTTAELGFITEEEYNSLPERVCYKRYPFYMPGNEPAGYYDSLSKLDPVVIFQPETLRTEEDWIKAGELIYDMPMNYFPLASSQLALLPVFAEKWKAAGIHGDNKSIIPFITIVVRKKGKPELATESCGMCHSRLMPDGQLFKGGQGNSMPDLFRNIMAVNSPGFKNVPKENRFKHRS